MPALRLISCFLKFGPARDAFEREYRALNPAPRSAPALTPQGLYDVLVRTVRALPAIDFTVWSRNSNHGGVARTPAGGFLPFLQVLGILVKVGSSGSLGSVGSGSQTGSILTLGEMRRQYRVAPLDGQLRTRLQRVIDSSESLRLVGLRPSRP